MWIWNTVNRFSRLETDFCLVWEPYHCWKFSHQFGKHPQEMCWESVPVILYRTMQFTGVAYGTHYFKENFKFVVKVIYRSREILSRETNKNYWKAYDHEEIDKLNKNIMSLGSQCSYLSGFIITVVPES